MNRILSSAVKLGLILWAAGQLPAVTRYFEARAAWETRHGLVSLARLNRSLAGNSARGRGSHEK